MAEKVKKRRAKGEGNIRQRPNGTWEARFIVGIDPGTGKDIRKSVYAKTQKEVRQKMTAAIAALDNDDYKEPSKMTVGQWLDIWARDYLGGVKPYTVVSYTQHIENHIKPAMGAVKLEALNAHTIQGFYNALGKLQGKKPALSAKTIKNVHGVLHKALQQAVMNGYIKVNPTDACALPRIVKKEMHPLDEAETKRFVAAIKGHYYEDVFLATLYTGMRQGEVLGLTWDRVDFKRGTITIDRQLQKDVGGGSSYSLVLPKNSKGRVITPPDDVMRLLQRQRRKQAEWRLKAGPAWSDRWGLVFTNEVGGPIMPHTLYHNFKHVVEALGFPEMRFHDLRHTYAVAAILAGVDIKTVQANLGHATAAFTLDVYGHVTEQMKRKGADKMQEYIDSLKTG